MKKLFALLMTAALLLGLGACGNVPANPKSTNEAATSTHEEITDDPQLFLKTEGTPSTTAFPLVGSGPKSTPENPRIYVQPGIQYASFENPNPLRKPVRAAYIGIDNVPYDAEITIETVLRGNEARELLESWGEFDETDRFIFEKDDVYLLKVKIENEDGGSPYSYFGPANQIGHLAESPERLSFEKNRLIPEQTEGWTELIAPKGLDIRPAYFIGSPFEAPGVIAVIYFALK